MTSLQLKIAVTVSSLQFRERCKNVITSVQKAL